MASLAGKWGGTYILRMYLTQGTNIWEPVPLSAQTVQWPRKYPFWSRQSQRRFLARQKGAA